GLFWKSNGESNDEIGESSVASHRGVGGALGTLQYRRTEARSQRSVYHDHGDHLQTAVAAGVPSRRPHLTYVEPGEYGGGYALRTRYAERDRHLCQTGNLEVLWRQRPTGGQAGGPIGFTADGQYLFLAVGDRQRTTPAQDPDQPVGKN